MATKRKAPTPRPSCGTVAGRQAHYRAGEVPCRPCQDAGSEYQRQRRQAEVEELHALHELARRYPEEFGAILSMARQKPQEPAGGVSTAPLSSGTGRTVSGCETGVQGACRG